MTFHPPASVLAAGYVSGEYKVSLPAWNLVLRGAMAGAYIGMGAALMIMVTTGMEMTLGSGFSRLIAGMVFPLGVILTVLTGAELFTGDAMIAPMAAFQGRISWMMVIRLWALVWAGNCAGALLYAAFMAWGPLMTVDSTGAGMITSAGITTVGMAAAKCGGGSLPANGSLILSAIAAGWLLNLGVLLAMCADDVIGKIMGVWFPVMAMTATGLEHAVTNMYLIPAGLLTAGRLTPLQVAQVGPAVADLGWSSMIFGNLIWTSLGNLIGSLIFAGLLFWSVFRYEAEK